MNSFLNAKTVLVVGGADEAHRAVALAIATAGANVAVAGETADISAQAALHSIANEIWALGRQSAVSKPGTSVIEGLGEVSLVVGCQAR